MRPFAFLLMALVLIGSLVSAEPIRLGVSLSLEGNYEQQSHMLRDGYLLWVEEANSAGGMLGRPLELVILDDKGDPDQVRENYHTLIDDEHVDLVLAPYSTPLTLAASEVTEAAGYPLIATGAAGGEIWKRGYRYVFGMYALADRFFIGYLDILARQGFSTVAVAFEDNTFNLDAAAGVVEWASRFGLSVADRIKIDVDSPDLPAVAERLQGVDADGVIVCSYHAIGYGLLQLFGKIDYVPRSLAMTIIPIHDDFPLRAGPISEGVFAPSQWEPSERIPFPGTSAFIETFERTFGESPSYHAASAYGSGQLIMKAVTAVGRIDRSAIRDYIAAIDTVTVMGRFRADLDGKQIGHNSILIQWQDGTKEIVYPRDMQTAPPRFEDR